jgi:hypothetical protein
VDPCERIRTQLPKIATQVPNGTKPESRGKRFARWVDNATITAEVYFVPYAEVLLWHLAVQTLVVILNQSTSVSFNHQPEDALLSVCVSYQCANAVWSDLPKTK